MHRSVQLLLLSLIIFHPAAAQESSDPSAQALAQGDLFESKRKYELAFEAYLKADKLSHHTCAQCYLKMSNIERRAGDFPTALGDARRAMKAAGDNKTVAVQAYLACASLLADSFVQTHAGSYFLNIELFAYSAEELVRVASSLQAISISAE